MTETALALVLAGAMLHALWNVVAKRSAGGPAFVILFGWVSAIAATPAMAWAWSAQSQTFTMAMGAAALVSALVHMVYSLVLQQGYRVGDFAVVYPIARGVGPTLSVTGAVLLLGEVPSPAGWLGVGLVLGGVLITAGILEMSHAAPAKRRLGVVWGVLTGALIALYTLLDGWAVRSLGAAPLLFYGAVLWCRVVLFAPWAFHRRAQLSAAWQAKRGAIVLVGVVSPLAYVLVLFAMQVAPVAYVAPVREISMFGAALLGARFLREPLGRTQLVGALLMITGVLALALA